VSGNLARWVDLSLTVTQVEPQGVLDETFGSGGKVLLDLEPGNAYYGSRIALLVQPDGKIIMGGARADVTTNPNVLHTSVVRFHPDGTLDTSFGNGGMFLAHYSVDIYLDDWWGGADLTPDDGVVLTVKAANRRPGPNNCPDLRSWDILVAKLSGSGQPLWTRWYNLLVDDRGTPNNPCDDVYSGFEPEFVRVGPDGKILIGGWNNSGYVGFDGFGAFLLRLNPDGTPDASFGSGGKVLVPRTSAAAYYAATFLPDGRIVVGGNVVNNNNTDLLVARYHPDGTLDTSFGTGGFTVLNPGNTHETVYDIKLQPDGKLVLAIAVGTTRTGVCRLNPDGSLDQGFHCGTVHQGPGAGSMGALALQPNGKVLLVAMNFYAFYVYRLAATDGSQEASWSFGFGGPGARGYGIAYLPDHKILVGGWASNGSFWDFALVRLR